jgi:hypothetical protein
VVPLTGILDHDGNVDGVGNGLEKLVDGALADPKRGAMVGRHHHDHGCAGLLCAAAALGADA